MGTLWSLAMPTHAYKKAKRKMEEGRKHNLSGSR